MLEVHFVFYNNPFKMAYRSSTTTV